MTGHLDSGTRLDPKKDGSWILQESCVEKNTEIVENFRRQDTSLLLETMIKVMPEFEVQKLRQDEV
ncbi:uncharacterized protein LOC143174344 isoform X3 [Nomia melanderi]